jgi:hypothetical protein
MKVSEPYRPWCGSGYRERHLEAGLMVVVKRVMSTLSE